MTLTTGTSRYNTQRLDELAVTGLAQVEQTAHDYAVATADAVLIALNLWGVASHHQHGRVRVEVDLEPIAPGTPEWHLIVPAGRNSPFRLAGDQLLLDNQVVGRAREVEHDDAQLGYVRGGGQGLTLNTNRRSTCTGCVFCPNTLADAADPRTSADGDDLATFLEFLCLREGWADLSAIDQVNLSTGCFGTSERAIAHLASVRAVLDRFGFAGRLGILSSVIRTPGDFARMREAAGCSALFLTLECLGRRDLILKDTKADLTPEAALTLLEHARQADVDTGVTLIVGLDDPEAVAGWLERATPWLTDFPNLQVYQSHGPLMDIFRQSEADRLEFMLAARARLEEIPFASRPVWWQNFRPLWHHHYGGEQLR
jgi:hypothetical protein